MTVPFFMPYIEKDRPKPKCLYQLYLLTKLKIYRINFKDQGKKPASSADTGTGIAIAMTSI